MTHLDVFQVIADPTRRRIVESLRVGEQQVNDVVQKLDIHQSGVSRHLRILHDAGFVQMRTDGQRHLYSLRSEPFQELDHWLSNYRDLWEARLDRFERALDAKKRSRAKKQNPKKSELS
jgi:DNA-binding transcriptional ArsR family regulator